MGNMFVEGGPSLPASAHSFKRFSYCLWLEEARWSMNLIEKLVMWVAWNLPRRIAYWCAVRVHTEATQKLPEKDVLEISVIDALRVWSVK